jgi:hypothetical protein
MPQTVFNPREENGLGTHPRLGNVLDLCLVSLAIMEDATYRESAHRSSAQFGLTV